MKDSKLYKASIEQSYVKTATSMRNLLRVLRRGSVLKLSSSEPYLEALAAVQELQATLVSVKTLHSNPHMVE